VIQLHSVLASPLLVTFHSRTHTLPPVPTQSDPITHKTDLRAAAAANAELSAIRATSQVHALTLLPESRRALLPLGGGLLAAVLHEIVGPAHRSVNLDCVELHQPSGALLRGPWSLRSLHPTTRLLHQLPPRGGGEDASGRAVDDEALLVISSRGVILVMSGAAGGAKGGTGEAGIGELVRWELAGLPTAVTAVGGNARRLVVADSEAGACWGLCVLSGGSGITHLLVSPATVHLNPSPPSTTTPPPPRPPPPGLHLLDLSGPSLIHARITTSGGAVSVPSTLGFLPLAPPPPLPSSSSLAAAAAATGAVGSGSSGLQGILFVGSTCGSSQAIGVAARNEAQDAAPWPVLQSVLLPSLAPALCAAPVTPSDGPNSLPEAQLLVGCGRAPRGRVARVRSGVGLRPFILDGPELPVSAGAVRGWVVFRGLAGAAWA